MNVNIRELELQDCRAIADAFAAIGWADHKPLSRFERYRRDHDLGRLHALVALRDEIIVGYLTIVWQSTYSHFRCNEIPEVKDLNVLPKFRRRGIATKLMNAAETTIKSRSPLAGIGVGMYPDYGSAQRLYVKRGYIPDGRGLTYAERVLAPMERVINDDDLVLYLTKKLV